MSKLNLITTVAVCGLLAGFGTAQAQPSSAQSVESVTVTGDAAHLIETVPNSTAFGLSMSLIDTPRAITVISDTTIDRYGISGVNALTSITPSAYTASFYGIEGAVNLRGTLAENYFRGFKRVENRGTYSTPIADAAQIEIVRGPPTPIYGAGKVGGLLNFIPKSAQVGSAYLTRPEGEVTAMIGAYGKSGVTAQGGAPVSFGIFDGGVHLYGEWGADGDYYHGISPEKRMFEASADFGMGNGWSTAFRGMVFRSDGDVQTPGWNRLTQNLVDHSTYITGRDTSVVDLDHNGPLTPTELSPA